MLLDSTLSALIAPLRSCHCSRARLGCGRRQRTTGSSFMDKWDAKVPAEVLPPAINGVALTFVQPLLGPDLQAQPRKEDV